MRSLNSQAHRALGIRAHPTSAVLRRASRGSCLDVLALGPAFLRGSRPLVPVVEPTYSTVGVDGGACRALVHGASRRRVLRDPQMRSVAVAVG